MARVGIKSILYRRLNTENLKTLLGTTSTKYIAYGQKHAYFDTFLSGLSRQARSLGPTDKSEWESNTDKANELARLSIAAIDDTSDYPAIDALTFYPDNDGPALRQRHKGVAREQEEIVAFPWKIAHWAHRLGQISEPQSDTHYALLIRDTTDTIHARFLKDRSGFGGLQSFVTNKAFGVITLDGIAIEDELTRQVYSALCKHKNVLLNGPPGTGKTHLCNDIKNLFGRAIENTVLDTAAVDNPFVTISADKTTLGIPANVKTEFVTFHQSTSYESFVAGLRPRADKNGNMTYPVEVGPLVELADHASKKGCASLLIIDEINRGNTAEIFGELITLIEDTKRTKWNEKNIEWKARLPYMPADRKNHPSIKDDGLTLPEHLYILASMNSVDRSVAPLDSALRRRFRMVELPPRPALLEELAEQVSESIPDTEKDAWEETKQLAIDCFKRINHLIALYRGPDFRLGHSYFWKVFALDPEKGTAHRQALLAEALAEKVLPQLREIFRDQPEVLVRILGGRTETEIGPGKIFRYAKIKEGDDFGDATPERWVDFGEPDDDVIKLPKEQEWHEWKKILEAIRGQSTPEKPKDEPPEGSDVNEALPTE